MIRYLINFFLFIFILTSCQTKTTKNITEFIDKKKEKIINIKTTKNDNSNNNEKKIFYLVGDPYFIEGVEYIPTEDYNYKKIGLASYYGKELHNKRTVNNDINKVTELLGRHKTLPLPSTVKITNLENGLSLIIKINDRFEDNSSIIQVSRKVAQLLRFYKNKIARVQVEILSDPSKQMKIVTKSMNSPDFDNTIDSAPTEGVMISDLNEVNYIEEDNEIYIDQPIELNQEEVNEKDLYLKVYDFKSYDEAKNIVENLNLQLKNTTEKDGEYYSIIIGPLNNVEANKLVSTFISKGYKKTEIILN